MAVRSTPAVVGARHAPLSPAQFAIWLRDRMTGDPTLYREHACYELLGPLDPKRFAAALRAAVAAHPAFGAAVLPGFHGVPELHLDQHIIEVEHRHVTEGELADVLDHESLTGPALDGGPLTRCLLLSVTPERHVMLMVWHHLVADGMALRVLLETLQDCWDDPARLPEAGGPTVCDANLAYLAAAESAAARERARAAADRLTGLALQPLPRTGAGAGASRREVIGEGVGAVDGLAQAAVAARLTVPMLLAAACRRAAGEVLGLEDFLLGCVTAGRWLPDFEKVVGCFVNTVLVPANSGLELPVREHVRSGARELAAAVARQDIPFTAVAGHLLRDARPRPRAFPQIYLSMDTPTPLRLTGLECRRVRIPHAQAKFDVTLIVEYDRGGVHGVLQYRDDVLTPATAQRFVRVFLARLRELPGALVRPSPAR